MVLVGGFQFRVSLTRASSFASCLHFLSLPNLQFDDDEVIGVDQFDDFLQKLKHWA